jgi:glycosyltransferase involved in cell wall biosynthesis
MRVLWLTPELPFAPGGTGGATRQFQLIRVLVERGHAVDVVAPVHPAQVDGARLLRAAGATLHAAPRPASRVGETLGALARRPSLALDAARLPVVAWQVEVFWTSLRPLALAALDQQPDVLVIEHDWAARWAADLPTGTAPRTVTLQNLSWRYYTSRAAAASGPAAALLRLEARRFAAFDRRRLPAYAARVTMSQDDAAAMEADLGLGSAVIPNGVDTSALAATPLPAEPVALFTGTFDYPPNAEALAWLLSGIWPRVLERRADARLLVVGRDVPERLAAQAGPSVQVAGWVPEMQPWFDRARVVIVPMRSGGGTRLKVLDGLASGRPLVTTTMGAEGVALAAGEQTLIADEGEAFADAVLRTFADDALATRLGTAGRRLAEDTYDWRAIGARYAELLEAVAAGERSDPSATLVP